MPLDQLSWGRVPLLKQTTEKQIGYPYSNRSGGPRLVKTHYLDVQPSRLSRSDLGGPGVVCSRQVWLGVPICSLGWDEASSSKAVKATGGAVLRLFVLDQLGPPVVPCVIFLGGGFPY